MSLESELAIIKGDRERVTVDEIEQWAQEHPESEWHRKLEWDDRVGARHWRHQQIRVILISHFRNEDGVRQVISLSIDRTSGGGYRDLNAVVSTPNMRSILLQDVQDELNRVKAKFESFVEYARVWDEIEAAERATAGKRRKTHRSGSAERSAAQ